MAVMFAASAFAAADPSKVVRSVFEAPDDGFDMVRTANLYSAWVSEAIFETLLGYDYLARPAKLVPRLAEALPEITDGGKTYVFRIRKGIYFSPDAAFKGKRRELTANDFAYAFKRVLDPVNRSPSASFLAGKIVGLDALAEQAKKTGKFNYDAPVAGIQMPDPHTLRLQLNEADYNFQYAMAYVVTAAVAREAVEAYGPNIAQHPVGTGPYMLHQYTPRSKIVLVANPDFRGFVWDFQPSTDVADMQIVRDMQGKQMPQVGRVEISIIEEEQSRWLAFQDKQIDIDWIPQVAATSVLEGGKLKPEFSAQGLQLTRLTTPGITYTLFNFRNPVLGGFSLEKIALRRAIAMAYDVKADIAQIRRGQAIKAEMTIPPGVSGYDPAYRRSIAYDINLANQLLDRYGYKRDQDGWRSLPDGKPLLLVMTGEANSTSRIHAEIWKRGLDQLGIKADFPVSNFADNLKAATECKLMMWTGAWYADYPEGENFQQLMYGPNAGQGNHGCYQSAAFDALFRKAMALPPGPERTELYKQMNRQAEADTVWVLGVYRIRNWVNRPWIKGFKRHPILQADWQYLDVEKH